MRARLARALRRAADHLAPATHHVTIRNEGTVALYIDGETVVRAIRQRNRRRGLPGLG